MRPEILSTDEAKTIDVIIHAIKYLPEKYQYVVLLQPTSPLRTVSEIDNLISVCLNSNASSATTVTKVDKPLEWIYTLDEQRKITPYMKSYTPISRRQDSTNVYQLNGAVYVSCIDTLLKHEKLITHETIACEMPDYQSIDIDTELDFIITEQIIEKIINKNV